MPITPKERRVITEYGARRLRIPRAMSNEKVTMLPDEIVFRYGRLSLAYASAMERLQVAEKQRDDLLKENQELKAKLEQSKDNPGTSVGDSGQPQG